MTSAPAACSLPVSSSDRFSRCTEKNGVRAAAKSRRADIRTSLPPRVQKRVAVAGPGEEALDESVHVPHGEEAEAGRTSAAEAAVRLTGANKLTQHELLREHLKAVNVFGS